MSRLIQSGRAMPIALMRMLGFLLTVATCAATASPAYEVSNVGGFGGPVAPAAAINKRGEVVGFATLAGNVVALPYVYRNRVLISLGSLGGNIGQALAISDRGQVTGFSQVPDGSLHAFIYTNGSMQDIGTIAGPVALGFGINDKGVAVGWSSFGAASRPKHAFVYANGAMTDLGTFGGGNSLASCINDRGQVAGFADLPDGTEHAFLYEKGAMLDLGVIGDATSSSYAEAINARGDVVGFYTGSLGNGSFAFYYSNGAMNPLPDLGGPASFASSINSRGEIAGAAELPGTDYHAVVWDSNHKIADLNSLIDSASLPPGAYLRWANGINDAGDIAAVDNNGQGYVLTRSARSPTRN